MTAAPSMSKSIRSGPQVSTTCWYCAASADTLVQDWASSVPFAPPKDTRTSSPSARKASMSALSQPAAGSYAPNQLAVHGLEPLITRAGVNCFGPLAAASWVRLGVGYAPRSTWARRRRAACRSRRSRSPRTRRRTRCPPRRTPSPSGCGCCPEAARRCPRSSRALKPSRFGPDQRHASRGPDRTGEDMSDRAFGPERGNRGGAEQRGVPRRLRLERRPFRGPGA